MIFPWATTKTVTFGKTDIVKWNCHLTDFTRATTQTVTSGRKDIVKWNSQTTEFAKLRLAV